MVRSTRLSSKEIGGYIEFERFEGSRYHDAAIPLNCGRGCISYLVESRNISSVWLPRFICSSVPERFKHHGVQVFYYDIDEVFNPVWDEIGIDDSAFFYLVDYYGQLSDEIIWHAQTLSSGKTIVDESQGFFESPCESVDTLYTARKFFGVSDGAYLYTDSRVERVLARDESHDRMRYLMGRLERSASEFYSESKSNNRIFDDEPAKLMSKTTMSLLAAVDYDYVRNRRESNYAFLEESLEDINELSIHMPRGPFAYPLLVSDGRSARKALADRRIYIPTLWPDILEEVEEGHVAYRYARDILPLPVDQRYDKVDMATVLTALKEEGII